MSLHADAWVLEKAGQPLVRRTLALEPGDMDAVVEVEGCGLCHTDLGFADGSVSPRHALPLVLGHEISGKVVAAKHAGLVGKKVLVPAVMSCGVCAFCRAGRGNACPMQTMPGNDANGGFATHVVVPAQSLVSLEGAPANLSTDAFGVVADAVSTAYQAVRRAWLDVDDVAFVIGAGGVGGFLAQIARALGARVIACDVDPVKLARLAALGIETVVVTGKDAKEVRRDLHARAKKLGAPSLAWRIFECSGTTSGQLLAYALLAQASTLVVVGYTREMINIRLSNVMAFDATVLGSWGCPRERYADVLDLVFQGSIALEPFIERAPMSSINAHLRALAEHRLERRLVLDPHT